MTVVNMLNETITVPVPDDGRSYFAEESKSITDTEEHPALPHDSDTEFPNNGTPIEPRGIVGKDQRKKVVSPQIASQAHRSVVFLQLKIGDGYGSCSGGIAGPHLVFTAAHCLYNKDAPEKNRWAQDVKVIVGKEGDTQVRTCKIDRKRTVVPKAWYVDHNYDRDWAIIKHDCDLSMNFLGFNRRVITDKDFESGKYYAFISGYPRDKMIENANFFMYEEYGEIEKHPQSPLRFRYRISTDEGQSGSPIWFDGERGPVMIGIHSRGFMNQTEDKYNYGVRLGPGMLAVLHQFMNE
ncbi:trypsin-like serine protease [Lysinibacter sp. HNR]|uniref:trypsin-like serine peptidase n=1 Tax=Lysinibacter sp. HNR TaxID=3031408 RepID=UPI002435A8AE|nr:trypsin-like serine protease [Lysinibacter sp. HNR]WGD36862.1 trypsin-like serine protease [Lysinibacter sp. HNR]